MLISFGVCVPGGSAQTAYIGAGCYHPTWPKYWKSAQVYMQRYYMVSEQTGNRVTLYGWG